VLFAALGAACTAPVVDDVADAQSAMTQGVVVVERSLNGEATETSISAKFMRMSASADPDFAERVVGSRFELPAAGTCTSAPSTEAESPLPDTRASSIELLDVGDLVLRAGRSATLPLAARAFPDVGDLAHGVFYVSPEPAQDLPGGGTYLFQSSGSPLIDGFAISVEAPATPEEVWIGDDLLAQGTTLEADAPALVRWRPPTDEASQRNDRIVVDLTPSSGATVRCAFPDVGEAIIPAAQLTERALGAMPATVTIQVHRIRQVSFGTAAIHAGEVRFDLSLIGRAIVAAPEPSETASISETQPVD
jgi:hypothetical protein